MIILKRIEAELRKKLTKKSNLCKLIILKRIEAELRCCFAIDQAIFDEKIFRVTFCYISDASLLESSI